MVFTGFQLLRCTSVNLLEIWADGRECAILHSEAFRNRAELREAEAFVEMPGVDVPLDDGVELENPESMRLCLCVSDFAE
jgi:hypothetical protein